MATAIVSLGTCVLTSVTWCFCSACTSLLGACCGNDKPSTVPPGAASGRKRSILVFFLSIGLSLFFQWYVGPNIVSMQENTFTKYIRNIWLSGCEDLEFDDNNPDIYDEDLLKACVGIYGNYRVSFATTLFFTIAAIAAYLKPIANRIAWSSKYILYLFLVGIMFFIPSQPLYTDIFLWIGRFGGVLFILFQQLIIVDVAYNWNDSWVENSNKAESEETGTGKKWLVAIGLGWIIMFGIWIAACIYMFIDFTGCSTNNLFIALTVLLPIFITIAQLSNENGDASLLSSATIAAWTGYLCYSAVSKNPNETCNPRLGEMDAFGITIGMGITIMSAVWSGWSMTAEDKLNLRAKKDDNDDINVGEPKGRSSSTPDSSAATTTGIVVGGGSGSGSSNSNSGNQYGTNGNDEEAPTNDDNDDLEPNGPDRRKLSNSSMLNILLLVVTCFKSMTLTQWGAIQTHGNISNPTSGSIGMWMIIVSQWVALTLYLWTLIAPRIFPDRDFS